MISISSAGLSTTALVANQVSLLVDIKERLCKPYCVNSSIQPQISISYTADTPTLNESTVFVPIEASVTIVTSGCGCKAITQLFTERFTVAFQGQTAIPGTISIKSLGKVSEGSDVKCCKAHSYNCKDSLTVSIS